MKSNFNILAAIRAFKEIIIHFLHIEKSYTQVRRPALRGALRPDPRPQKNAALNPVRRQTEEPLRRGWLHNASISNLFKIR